MIRGLARLQMLRRPAGATMLLVILVSNPAFLAASSKVAAGEGSCPDQLLLRILDKRSTQTPTPLRVIRQGAGVYRDRAGKRQVAGPGLNFGDAVYATRTGGSTKKGLIKVRPVGAGEDIGWMKRGDLLCRTRTLKTDLGGERKLIVKPPPVLDDETSSVPAFDSPDSDRCLGDSCLELSRFEMRFIYATAWHKKRGQPETLRYLVAEVPHLGEHDQLTGWVDAEHAILWGTALGLRPRTDAGRLEILPSRGSQTLAEVMATEGPHAAMTFEGGNSWFRSAKRIAVLGLEELDKRQFYRVAFPGVGIEALAVDEAIEKAQNLKRVDVFFLIDGTRGMGPFIRAARQAAAEIARGLANAPGFEETYFRYGFRFYRDSYAGGGGTGEGLPLDTSADACHNDRQRSERYFAEFDQKIRQVRATGEDGGTDDEGDDHPESLFNGLRRAAADLESCPDQWKLLFVIGDAGDHQPTVPEDVIAHLRSNRRLVPFFIRANREDVSPEASQRFVDQGREILQSVLPATFQLTGEAIDVERHIVDLTDSELPPQVRRQVASYASSRRANEVILALRSGQPLDQILTGLRRENEAADVDVPILHWQRVRDLMCGDDESRCPQRVPHDVMEGYTEVSDEWVEELWLSESDLDRWLSLLLPLTRLAGQSPSAMKQAFVDVQVAKLESILGSPRSDRTNETTREFLERRRRLPSRGLSPLMQYELQEIFDMQHCELARLVLWAKQIRQILLRVSADPTIRMAFELQPYPEGTCPIISDKGKRLQRIILNNSREALGDSDEYRYNHTYLGETGYWLPKDFLP